MVVLQNQTLTRGGSSSTKAIGQASNVARAVAQSCIMIYHEVSR
jgi:hypothetical protein